MVTNDEQPIWTTFTVSAVTQVTGRNNRPEYELTGRWEWTPTSNTWGDKTYCPRDICPEVINPGPHTVLARRGELKKDRNSELYDGSHQWMYRWRIVEWEGVVPEGITAPPPQAAPQPAPEAPVAPPPQTQSQPVVQSRPIDENQMRIMRQATLKCASWMMVPLMKEFSNPLLAVQRTEELSEMFMEYVISGKVKIADETPDPVDEWEA